MMHQKLLDKAHESEESGVDRVSQDDEAPPMSEAYQRVACDRGEDLEGSCHSHQAEIVAYSTKKK